METTSQFWMKVSERYEKQGMPVTALLFRNESAYALEREQADTTVERAKAFAAASR